jgi:surfactin synthase thioesterase subunit
MTEGSGSGPGPRWFEHLSRARMPLLRVFCLPYAGGSTEVYRGWQRWFPPEIDICLIHLPGRGRRMAERAFTRAMPLVNAIAERMGPELTVPYALYGHSMGALISFELSWELIRRYGDGPQHLFVSGRSAPQWPRLEPPTFHLPHDDFIAELRRLNGTPPDVLDNPDLIKLFLGVLRADFEAVETYEYRSRGPLDCPITVYCGLQDEDVSQESCRAWRDQTTSCCEIRMLNGDHFLVRDPQPEFVNAFRNDILSAVPSWRGV